MNLGKDSEIYDEEVNLYAEYILTSIFLNSMPKMEDMTIRDLIWMKVALREKNDLNDKKSLNESLIQLDNRFLLKDISDVTRLKASGGKSSSTIKERDFPSVQILNKMESEQKTSEQKLEWLNKLNERLNKNK